MFTVVAPYVKASPENFEVLVGQNASFNCSVSGNPQPVVRWYHREAPVTSDSMRLHVSDDHTLLTVVGTQPEDAGLIICQAENTVIDLMRKITMTTQSSAVLTVNGEVPSYDEILMNCIVALCSTA